MPDQIFYVALCRTCNDRVRTFQTRIDRAVWRAHHKQQTGHDDCWQAETDETEH